MFRPGFEPLRVQKHRVFSPKIWFQKTLGKNPSG